MVLTKEATTVDTTGLSAGAKAFAKSLPDVKYGKPEPKTPRTTKRMLKSSLHSTTRQQHGQKLIVDANSAEFLKDLSRLVDFIQEEIPVKKSPEKQIKKEKFGIVSIEVLASSQKLTNNIRADITPPDPYRLNHIYPEREGVFNLTENNNVKILGIIFHLSLTGPSGTYNADFSVIGEETERFSAVDVASGRAGPSLFRVNYDTAEQLVLSIIASLRMKAFPEPALPENITTEL